MTRRFLILTALLLSTFSTTPSLAEHKTLTAEEAHAIGIEAYVYFYPLISMDITRKVFTNAPLNPAIGKGPLNSIVSMPAYPPGDYKGVVRPNFDTLYSSAWFDLTKEPAVLSLPDTGERYCLFPMLDMWSDVFASPGWRTSGSAAARYLVTPPGWNGKVPAGMEQIKAPTPYIWMIGRTKTDGPADYDAVHKLQAGYKLTPLSRYGKPEQAAKGEIDPTVDMKTAPKAQADTMPIEKYLAYAAELLKVNPPHSTDYAQLARLKQIGIEPGKSWSISSLDPAIQKALQEVPQDAQRLMLWKMASMARVANHWSMNTDTMGVYGNYYLKRAIVAQAGLGANQPEDAIYPLNLGDEDGNPLTGEHAYKVHFNKDEIPPVDAFWSITLYDMDGFAVPNTLNRFAVSSWMPFTYNADGSLDLYVQNETPGKDKEQNWLPAPTTAFNLTMRLYAPKSDALTGKWNPPPVLKAE